MDLDDDELKANKQRNNDDYVKTLETKIIELKKNFITCSLWELENRITELYDEVMNKGGQINE